MEALNEFLRAQGIYTLIMILFFWASMVWCSVKIT